jgi:uncharacterized protein GlcG (DUF336 family)
MVAKSTAPNSLKSKNILLAEVLMQKSFASCLKLPLFILLSITLLTSCGGGGGGSGAGTGSSESDFGCDGGCPNLSLSVTDIRKITQQAVAAAIANGTPATIALVDRVGNVLAVYSMDGAAGTTVFNGQIGAQGGLEGFTAPAVLAAISKAGTGAYLSSQGNAFSTRTASQIIQEHFDPGELNAPGGPLFGVQFSQLPCSDIAVLATSSSAGPHPLPLGLSADPGGFPLYINGDVVGGIGVEFNGTYTLDRNIRDYDDQPEERVALTATIGFEAPSERVAERIYAAGRSLRFSDLRYEDLAALPEELPALNDANFISVSGFTTGGVKAGVAFGDPGSGVLRSVRAGVASGELVNASGGVRFPARSGVTLAGMELKPNEVNALLDSALLTASRLRAAIRQPLDTAARVSIWIVDTQGNPLGFARSQDAPVFGIDVALQKARTAAFFSRTDAGAALTAAGFGGFVGNARGLMGPSALANGVAFSNRAVGNLARPFFADGIDGNGPGPYSLPFPGTAPGPSWSPFNTGLQLNLVLGGISQALSGSRPSSCSSLGSSLANGIQIFPGSVPLYRDGILIGAIGVSGDGIDQDDAVAFYGASRQGLDEVGQTSLGNSDFGFNAPKAIRSDTISLSAEPVRLRYVNCPEAPFSGDNDQNVCEDF